MFADVPAFQSCKLTFRAFIVVCHLATLLLPSVVKGQSYRLHVLWFCTKEFMYLQGFIQGRG